MLAVELEQYLHEHIPLSRAMAVGVASIDEGTVILRAPLAPNINHQESVFGGSASALAILAGWSLLHVRLRAAGVASRLVIQRNTVDYEQPLTGAFTARAWLEHYNADA
jgi:thioesterase domain-containing protein